MPVIILIVIFFLLAAFLLPYIIGIALTVLGIWILLAISGNMDSVINNNVRKRILKESNLDLNNDEINYYLK
jgi:hypothetical protein